MRQKFHAVVSILLALPLCLAGCGKHNNESQYSDINWSDSENAIVLVREPETASYFLINGSFVQKFRALVEETTIPQAGVDRRMQRVATQTVVYAVDKNGNACHYLLIMFQYVEGIGGKHDVNPDASKLLRSQGEKLDTVLEFFDNQAKQISEEQAQSYIQKFEQFDTGSKNWRYWKK